LGYLVTAPSGFHLTGRVCSNVDREEVIVSIVLEQLTKRYDSHSVVNNVSLEVGDGEFFVLLGSSGSGKTTILSLIAGLVPVDQGRIFLHEREVTYLAPQKRRVGFVFQNYALFQSMSVADNVEFGLSIRKVPVGERRQRRDEILELVGLAGLGNRMPWQLSGGQQQRVALARALVYKPDVLLLDEPLGALDAKIRVDLRRNLKAIQRKLGITTIFVTHDQEEAFDLADRIGVMSFGRLLEVGTPEELYQRPKTEFVASFLGTANLLVGNLVDGKVNVGKLDFPVSKEIPQLSKDHRVQVLFRPEDISLQPDPAELDSPRLGEAVVEEKSFGGTFEKLRLRLPPIPGVRTIAPPVPFGSSSIIVDATRSPEQAARFPLDPGDKTWVGVHRIHALAHPGLSFLIVTDGSLRAQSALTLGGQLARLAHARVTLLGCGPRGEAFSAHMQEARKQLGSGLASLEVLNSDESIGRAVAKAVERQQHDMVVLGFHHQEDIPLAEGILQAGEHHLLLATRPQAIPNRALVCITGGEPGKDDVLFAGRLVRHLSAEASVLSVVSPLKDNAYTRINTEQFLAGGVESLSLLGVPARSVIRRGAVPEEIKAEVSEGGYDLLVLGVPLKASSKRISLSGIVGQTLELVNEIAVLIVRSHYTG
jgi:sulfate transport system ATP-binding protein